MSSSSSSTYDSDSSESEASDSIFQKCTCKKNNHTCHDSSETPTSDSYESDSSDASSVNDVKNVFISVYKSKGRENANILTNTEEIKTYRKKYSQLTSKTPKNINNIWGDVKVQIPSFGNVALKIYDDDLDNESAKTLKKRYKKPAHIMSKKDTSDSSDSEDDTSNFMPTISKKVEEKLVIKTNNVQAKTVEKPISNKENDKKKPPVVNKPTKPTTADNILKSNLNNTNTKSNVGSKTNLSNATVKPNQTTTPVKSNTEAKSNTNNKNIRANSPEFKRPTTDKVLKSNNVNVTTKDNKNNQTNKSNDTEKSKQPVVTQKISKKKLKKLKQRERKLEDNNKRDTSNSSSRDVSESRSELSEKANGKKKRNKKLNKNAENESESEDMNTSNDEEDLVNDAENMPAFVSEVMKGREKKIKNTNPKVPTESSLFTSTAKTTVKKVNETAVNDNPFVLNTRKRDKPMPTPVPSKNIKNYLMYSEKFAEEALDMVLDGNLKGGLEYICEALSFNAADHRHYLNRSYIYLRMNQPASALQDAQHVIHTSSNIGHKFIAYLRAGQASLALQRYDQAEKFLSEATKINPENYHAQRESMRAKIGSIINMGYKERDALLALEIYPTSSLRASNYLSENYIKKDDSKYKNIIDTLVDNYDELIYSSDEEEKPNNVEILNRILNYEPGRIKLCHIVAKPSNSDLIHAARNDKNILMKNHPMLGKEKAIWVGNLVNRITEVMLRQKFKEFGKIVSVYRPPNEPYAFINFEKIEEVNNVLRSKQTHEIAGVKLAVRYAVRPK